MVSLFASVCVLVSCTGSSTQGDRAQGIKTAQIEAICREARGQILTIRGGEDIALLQCERQSDGDGGYVMVFSFNDNLEWYSLMTTMPTEDLVFTIPLGLVAYAFGRAGVSPANFSQVVISFVTSNSNAPSSYGSAHEHFMDISSRWSAPSMGMDTHCTGCDLGCCRCSNIEPNLTRGLREST